MTSDVTRTLRCERIVKCPNCCHRFDPENICKSAHIETHVLTTRENRFLRPQRDDNSDQPITDACETRDAHETGASASNVMRGRSLTEIFQAKKMHERKRPSARSTFKCAPITRPLPTSLSPSGITNLICASNETENHGRPVTYVLNLSPFYNSSPTTGNTNPVCASNETQNYSSPVTKWLNPLYNNSTRVTNETPNNTSLKRVPNKIQNVTILERKFKNNNMSNEKSPIRSPVQLFNSKSPNTSPRKGYMPPFTWKSGNNSPRKISAVPLKGISTNNSPRKSALIQHTWKSANNSPRDKSGMPLERISCNTSPRKTFVSSFTYQSANNSPRSNSQRPLDCVSYNTSLDLPWKCGQSDNSPRNRQMRSLMSRSENTGAINMIATGTCPTQPADTRTTNTSPIRMLTSNTPLEENLISPTHALDNTSRKLQLGNRISYVTCPRSRVDMRSEETSNNTCSVRSPLKLFRTLSDLTIPKTTSTNNTSSIPRPEHVIINNEPVNVIPLLPLRRSSSIARFSNKTSSIPSLENVLIDNETPKDIPLPRLRRCSSNARLNKNTSAIPRLELVYINNETSKDIPLPPLRRSSSIARFSNNTSSIPRPEHVITNSETYNGSQLLPNKMPPSTARPVLGKYNATPILSPADVLISNTTTNDGSIQPLRRCSSIASLKPANNNNASAIPRPPHVIINNETSNDGLIQPFRGWSSIASPLNNNPCLIPRPTLPVINSVTTHSIPFRRSSSIASPIPAFNNNASSIPRPDNACNNNALHDTGSEETVSRIPSLPKPIQSEKNSMPDMPTASLITSNRTSQGSSLQTLTKKSSIPTLVNIRNSSNPCAENPVQTFGNTLPVIRTPKVAFKNRPPSRSCTLLETSNTGLLPHSENSRLAMPRQPDINPTQCMEGTTPNSTPVNNPDSALHEQILSMSNPLPCSSYRLPVMDGSKPSLNSPTPHGLSVSLTQTSTYHGLTARTPPESTYTESLSHFTLPIEERPLPALNRNNVMYSSFAEETGNMESTSNSPRSFVEKKQYLLRRASALRYPVSASPRRPSPAPSGSQSNYSGNTGSTNRTDNRSESKVMADAVEKALTDIKDKHWEVSLAGLREVTRIAAEDPRLLDGHMKTVNRGQLKLLSSLRSAVVTEAARHTGSLFKTMRFTGRPEFDDIVSTLLKRTAEMNTFIKRDVNEALDEMVTYIPPALCVKVLVTKIKHQHKQVRTAVARLITCVVLLTGPDKILTRQSYATTRKSVLQAVATLLEDPNLETRTYGRELYKVLMTHEDFDAIFENDVSADVCERLEKETRQLRDKVSKFVTEYSP